MGRYSVPLAPLFADFAEVRAWPACLDVGCGPGALTAELVRRLGARGRSGRRPFTSRSSTPFAARHPGVDRASGRRPSICRSPDDAFDAALAQLVVHFMADPVAGLRRDGARDAAREASWRRACGITAAARARSSVYWDAAHELDPNVDDESKLGGRTRRRPLETVPGGGTAGDRRDRPLRRRRASRRSRTGGSRTRSAWARRATTSRASTKRASPASEALSRRGRG